MSARKQRLAELYKARAKIDARIRAMQGRDPRDTPSDVSIVPDPPLPTKASWRDVAHANQRMLWTLVHEYRMHHITHAPGMPDDREEAA